MSLIHDALKKAEKKDRLPIGSGLASLEEATESAKKGLPKRTIVLAAVLVVALAITAYINLKPKRDASAPQVPVAADVQKDLGKQDAELLKKKALNAYGADDFVTANSNLSAALDINSTDPELWNNLGLVSKKQGNIAKARSSYEKALELKPDYPEALNNLAVMEMDAGNATRATQLLERALKLKPAYPEANFNLAHLYETKGEKAKAVEYYKRFLDVSGSFSSSVVDAVRNHIMEIE